MYGRILRHLRESKGRSQADVARVVAISPAHLARLEAEKRGLYVEDFVNIVQALGEKPGNLLPNDVGTLGLVKPLVDRLAAVPPELLPQVTAIVEEVVLLAERSVGGSLPAVAPKLRRSAVRPATPPGSSGAQQPSPTRSRKGRR